MVEKILKPVVPGDEEIRGVIESIAKQAKEANEGYFYSGDLKLALEAAGFSTGSIVWPRAQDILGSMYNIDAFGPHLNKSHVLPFNANDPKRDMEPVVMHGMPDLGEHSSSVIDGSYRPGGQKAGGISPQAPKDLKTHE